MGGVRRSRQLRPAIVIRVAAVELAQNAATEREKDGDPEGADVIRDLAEQISKIPLSEYR